MTAYRVTARMIQVQLDDAVPPAGGQMITGCHLVRGQLLPEGVSPKQRRHLLSLKMIEPVADAQTPAPEPEPERRPHLF
jgi:hypothetical protein